MKKRILILLVATLMVLAIYIVYSFNITKNNNNETNKSEEYEGKEFQDIITNALIDNQLNGTSVIEYIAEKVGIDNIKELETGKYQVIYKDRVYELKEKDGGNYEISNMGPIQ